MSTPRTREISSASLGVARLFRSSVMSREGSCLLSDSLDVHAFVVLRLVPRRVARETHRSAGRAIAGRIDKKRSIEKNFAEVASWIWGSRVSSVTAPQHRSLPGRAAGGRGRHAQHAEFPSAS